MNDPPTNFQIEIFADIKRKKERKKLDFYRLLKFGFFRIIRDGSLLIIKFLNNFHASQFFTLNWVAIDMFFRKLIAVTNIHSCNRYCFVYIRIVADSL